MGVRVVLVIMRKVLDVTSPMTSAIKLYDFFILQ